MKRKNLLLFAGCTLVVTLFAGCPPSSDDAEIPSKPNDELRAMGDEMQKGMQKAFDGMKKQQPPN